MISVIYACESSGVVPIRLGDHISGEMHGGRWGWATDMLNMDAVPGMTLASSTAVRGSIKHNSTE